MPLLAKYHRLMISPLVLFQRLQSDLHVRFLRRQGAVVASSVRIIGQPLIKLRAGSTLTIGAGTRIVSDSRRTALGVNHPVVIRTFTANAEIVIGEHVGISGGSICAARKIEVGTGTMLGANVTIADTDFHPVEHASRRYEPMPVTSIDDAVIIGRNVFIGAGAYILKGTVLGDHCVVGAGAVVKGRFAAGTVVAGNPATVLRVLEFAKVP